MKLRLEQLSGHLQKGLQAIYFVSGDEPLQVAEACDAIRHSAREQGFTERNVLHVERGFDWSELSALGDSLSLFADKKLIELRMPEGKPGDAGGKALSAYAERPPEDTVLLIITNKLDQARQRSKWFKSLDKTGVHIAVWPLDARQLPGWIERRMQGHGMQVDPQALQLLSERVEGNLLAAAQEVEKLHLLYGPVRIGLEQVGEAVADSSRHELFAMVDTLLQGDAGRAARMLRGLQSEGSEPVLILWALVRELRVLVQLAAARQQGNLEGAFSSLRVWEKRKGLYHSALERMSARQWQALLLRAGQVDRVVKGMAAGQPWDALMQLALAIAGVRLLDAAS